MSAKIRNLAKAMDDLGINEVVILGNDEAKKEIFRDIEQMIDGRKGVDFSSPFPSNNHGTAKKLGISGAIQIYGKTFHI
jgi:hypothetical protein